MALPNPTPNIPSLPSPTKRRGPSSRLPSPSPVRYQRSAQGNDPLLRDLSPTSTLRAFSSAPPTDGLNRSIERASQSERASAAKAAQACVDLRSWVREVEGWEWPGTFDVPEPVRKKQKMSVGTMLSGPSVGHDVEDEIEEFWGSLPAQTVRSYERRIDEINGELDELDVEGLKDFVLSAHSQASHGGASMDDSNGAIGADTKLKRLDDFTALLTATILQALPYLSRLTRLMQTWTLRTRILCATPQYLADLKQARLDLDRGWAALAVSNHPAAEDALRKSNATFTGDTLLEMKQVVSRQIRSLGRRLDGFLDELEGYRDTVPERWIEEFEELEEQYGSWVVQAERKMLEEEWRENGSENATGVDDDTQMSTRGFRSGYDADDDRRPNTAPTVTRTAPTARTTTITGAASSTDTQTTTQHTSTGPLETSVVIDQPRSRSSSPRKNRNRHTPIIIEDLPTQLGKAPPAELAATKSRDASPLPPLQTPSSYKDSDTESQMVKKRAAFLNGTGDGLAKSKSPPIVRPFEHASNAFTRLFKRDAHPSAHTSAFAAAAGAMPMVENASMKSTGKRSSSSSKRQSEKIASDRTSQMSGGGSSQLSGGSSSMASTPGSEKRRSRGRRGKDAIPVTPRTKSEKMGYGDLVGVPEHVIEEELRRGYRRKKRDSRDQTSKSIEYGDMITVPERTSLDVARGRDTTPKNDLVPERKPHSPRSKGSSKQNITALPTLPYTEEVAMEPAKTSAIAPETYQPTGLSSSFHPPTEELDEHQALDVPADWPLSSTATPRQTPSPIKQLNAEIITAVAAEDGEGSASETREPEEAYSTEYFDRNFVESIPPQPVKKPISSDRRIGERQVSFRDTPIRIHHQESDEGDDDDTDDSGILFYNERPAPDRNMMRTGTSSSVRLLGLEDPSASRPLRIREAINAKRGSNVSTPGLIRPVSMVEEEHEDETQDFETPRSVMLRASFDADEDADDEEDNGIKNGIKELLDSPASAGYFSRAKAFAVLGVPSPDGSDGSKKPNGMSNAAGYFGTNASESPDEEEEDEEEFGVKAVKPMSSPGGYFSSSARASTGILRTGSSRTTQSQPWSMSPLQRSKSTPPVSPILKRLRIPTSSPTVEEADAAVEKLQEEKKGPVRRASATSIEAYSRSELRSIDVVRLGSMESPRHASAPSSAIDSRQNLDAPRTPTSPLHYKGATSFPSPLSVPSRGSSLNASPRKSLEAPALNAAMSKQKYKDVPRASLGKPLPLKPGEDNFDRHVSEVLDKVHAPIKFQTRPGAETPQPLQQRANAPLPKASERSGGKNMTLAPAEPSPKRPTPADPDVKLYHLTQAGRSEPIKLYVRLVGEGERVMVRVGGGWADLADYLRQYAEHHGSRTVSGSVVEVQSANNTPTDIANGVGRRTFSGPVDSRARSQNTPTTTFIPPLEPPKSRDSESIWLDEHQPRFTMGDSDDDPNSPTAIAFGTPGSRLSNSRPSTAHSASAPRRDSIPSDLRQKVLDSFEYTSSPATGPGSVGLAGPSKLRADLPEQKARWVEGMIQQVNKSASAEREERQKFFADMGRAGGTRRMVFRSSPGTVGGGQGGEK